MGRGARIGPGRDDLQGWGLPPLPDVPFHCIFLRTGSSCMQPENTEACAQTREFLAVALKLRGATLHHSSHPRFRPRHPPRDTVGISVPTSTPRRAEYFCYRCALFQSNRQGFRMIAPLGNKRDPWLKRNELILTRVPPWNGPARDIPQLTGANTTTPWSGYKAGMQSSHPFCGSPCRSSCL
jgi:hypothetical protein